VPDIKHYVYDDFFLRIFAASRYSDEISAVYKFTGLGRLKEEFARLII